MCRASEPRLEKDGMSVTLMHCVLCGKDIHPQTKLWVHRHKHKNCRRHAYTYSLYCTKYTHVQALGCSETGKTWVTPANPHSQTGLAQNVERLSGPSCSIQTRKVRAIFVWNLVTMGKCVHLAADPQMICSVLTADPSLDLFHAMSPGCVHVKCVCMCHECNKYYNVCYTCMAFVCGSMLGVTTYLFVIKVTELKSNIYIYIYKAYQCLSRCLTFPPVVPFNI